MRDQQVRQVPIFLGRRKRSVQGLANDDPKAFESSSTSSSFDDKVGQDRDLNTTDVPEPTTQVIEFTINGQHERFIVAKEVKVDVYPQDPLYDDYSLGPESTIMDAVSLTRERGSQSDDKTDNNLR